MLQSLDVQATRPRQPFVQLRRWRALVYVLLLALAAILAALAGGSAKQPASSVTTALDTPDD